MEFESDSTTGERYLLALARELMGKIYPLLQEEKSRHSVKLFSRVLVRLAHADSLSAEPNAGAPPELAAATGNTRTAILEALSAPRTAACEYSRLPASEDCNPEVMVIAY